MNIFTRHIIPSHALIIPLALLVLFSLWKLAPKVLINFIKSHLLWFKILFVTVVVLSKKGVKIATDFFIKYTQIYTITYFVLIS